MRVFAAGAAALIAATSLAMISAGSHLVDTSFDVVVFGATSAGVIAAVAAANASATTRLKIALVVVGTTPVGGMTSGGLSDVDAGDRSICGGYSREFFFRVGERCVAAQHSCARIQTRSCAHSPSCSPSLRSSTKHHTHYTTAQVHRATPIHAQGAGVQGQPCGVHRNAERGNYAPLCQLTSATLASAPACNQWG